MHKRILDKVDARKIVAQVLDEFFIIRQTKGRSIQPGGGHRSKCKVIREARLKNKQQ